MSAAGARRVDAGGAVLVSGFAVGWAVALILLALFTVSLLVVGAVVEAGGDPSVVAASFEALGTDPSGVFAPWVLALTMLVQLPAMLLLVPLTWFVADRLWYRRRGRATGRAEGWRGVFATARAPTSFFLLAVPIGLTVGLLPGWYASALRDAFPSLANGTLDLITDALVTGPLPWRLLLAFEIAVLAPLVEELVFRGFMWDALGRFLPVPAVWAVSSLLFCVYHMDPVQSSAIVPTALMLGWMRWASGSVWPCVLIHLVNNSLAVAATYAASDEVEATVGLALVGGMATIVLASALAMLRARGDADFTDRPLA